MTVIDCVLLILLLFVLLLVVLLVLFVSTVIISLHPVSVRRFPSFRTQPLENLKPLPMNKWISEQPSPWRKSSKRKSCYGDRVYAGGLVLPQPPDRVRGTCYFVVWHSMTYHSIA